MTQTKTPRIPDINGFRQNSDSVVNIRKSFDEARAQRERSALDLRKRRLEMRRLLLAQQQGLIAKRTLPQRNITPRAPRVQEPITHSVPVFENPHAREGFQKITSATPPAPAIKTQTPLPRLVLPAQTQTPRTSVRPAPRETTKKAPLAQVLKKRLTSRTGQQSIVLLLLLLGGASVLFQGIHYTQRISAAKQALTTQAAQALASADTARSQAGSFDFASAQSSFSQTNTQLTQLQQQLTQTSTLVGQLTATLPATLAAQSGTSLLEAGKSLARAGSELSLAAQILTDKLRIGDHVDLSATFLKQLAPSTGTQSAPAQKSTPLTTILGESTAHLDTALAEVTRAQQKFALVPVGLLPTGIKEQFVRISDGTNLMQRNLTTGSELAHFLMEIIGSTQQKRYLVIFHNNNELRADFGFNGTYALVDIDQGDIKKVAVDDIYNIDGQLKANINPPEPLAHLTPRWSLHDANFFLDYPTSARLEEWFFEKAGGPTVDGVIGLTPGVIQQLLAITGPIDMPEYHTTISQDNFIAQTQDEVETNYDRELNRPKKFLADFAPKLLSKLFEDKQALQHITPVIIQALAEKQMGMYFLDETLQRKAQEFNWTAEVKATDKDYLAIADNNIGGGKTDLLINEHITEEVTIQDDGTVIKKLTVTRNHTGPRAGLSVKNIDFMKIYVPEGSVLLDAQGFQPLPEIPKNPAYADEPSVAQQEQSTTIHPASQTRIMKESGKTVFGNWAQVEPQDQTTVVLTYRLPFSISLGSVRTHAQTYTELLQKQPGSGAHTHTLTVTYPASMKPLFQYPTDATIDAEHHQITWRNTITQDMYAAVTFTSATDK